MFELDGAEVVGYVASLLVVVSLAMSSVVRLRTISLVGSLTFVVYGALIGSAPIILTNAAIAVINVRFLRLELGQKRDLGASVIRSDAPFLADFIHFHLDDIRRSQPDFAMPADQHVLALLLLRDGLPAGALIGRQHGPELEILLDYVVRPYRDSRLGRWLFGPGSGVFRERGIERLVTDAGTELHRTYLERAGFRQDGAHYRLDLPK